VLAKGGFFAHLLGGRGGGLPRGVLKGTVGRGDSVEGGKA